MFRKIDLIAELLQKRFAVCGTSALIKFIILMLLYNV